MGTTALTRVEAIAGLRASHHELMTQLGALDWEAPLPPGVWRVRDMAADVAAWDRLRVDSGNSRAHCIWEEVL